MQATESGLRRSNPCSIHAKYSPIVKKRAMLLYQIIAILIFIDKPGVFLLVERLRESLGT
jgi:hypothetical protein